MYSWVNFAPKLAVHFAIFFTHPVLFYSIEGSSLVESLNFHLIFEDCLRPSLFVSVSIQVGLKFIPNADLQIYSLLLKLLAHSHPALENLGLELDCGRTYTLGF